MKRAEKIRAIVDLIVIALFVIVLGLFFVFVGSAQGRSNSNYDGGGGGYTQLPACSASWLGVTLYVQGYAWRCVSNPYHWQIV